MRAVAAAQFLPTRRELVLLALLFVGLLCFVPSKYVSDSASLYFGKAGVLDGFIGDVEKNGAVRNDGVRGISFPEPRMSWKETMPETEVLHHAPGWTVLDKLYIYNGTIYIVTSSPKSIPKPMYMTSSGYDMRNGPGEIDKRRPTSRDIQIVSPDEAQRIFFPFSSQQQNQKQAQNTKSVPRLTGVSFLNTDSPQFIAHYYHFSAEILFGLWRTYTALDPFISPDGHTTLPPPRRLIFRHVPASDWRDYAALNQWVLRGAFPNIAVEAKEDWQDRADMGVPFVLDRVVLGDRAASYESEAYLIFWRYTASAFELRGSANWWAPLRKSIMEFTGLDAEYITGASYGLQHHQQPKIENYVITYVSRQDWGRRMLQQEDHEKLVAELYKLSERYGYEVNVVSMDQLSRAEQIQLAGRTTILMGVHGNGLTSLVWMKPTPRSTVIEFFYPEGFAFDYEFTARALGMTHYGVWGNKTFTRPKVPTAPQYPEGFQGNDIPLDGAIVAKLVHERLTLNADDSHP